MAESVFESPVLRRALVRHQSRHEALLGWLFGRLLVTECVLRRWSQDDERRDAECIQVLRGNGYEVDRSILEMLEAPELDCEFEADDGGSGGGVRQVGLRSATAVHQ